MAETNHTKPQLQMRVDSRGIAGSAKARREQRAEPETRHDSAGGLARFMRFAGSSLLCPLFDQLLAGLLFVLLREPLRNTGFLRILIASVIARCFSQTLNYLLNHHLVFSGAEEADARPSRRESIPRFLAVATFVLGLSTIGVYLLNTFANLQESLAKILMDSLLFFVNYYLQHNWVFTTEPTINPRKIRRRQKTALH